MPVSSKKCAGRNLYNHLQQKNISADINYTYDKATLSWGGTFTVFGSSYEVMNQESKLKVLEELMKQSHDFIWSKLNENKK